MDEYPNSPSPIPGTFSKLESYHTPQFYGLLSDIREGKIDKVRAYLDLYPEQLEAINFRNGDDYRSPLTEAIYYQQEEIFNLLIEKGAGHLGFYNRSMESYGYPLLLAARCLCVVYQKGNPEEKKTQDEAVKLISMIRTLKRQGARFYHPVPIMLMHNYEPTLRKSCPVWDELRDPPNLGEYIRNVDIYISERNKNSSEEVKRDNNECRIRMIDCYRDDNQL